MSKLLGIVSIDQNDTVHNCFKQNCDASWNDDEGRQIIWNYSGAAIGFFNRDKTCYETQTFLSETEDRLICCGKLVDTGYIWDQLYKHNQLRPELGNDSALLYHLLTIDKNDFLSKLNGIFTAALWQPDSRRLTLINDRLGFRPLYYSFDRKKKRFIFSSDLRGVAAAISQRTVNWQAASVFLHFGHHLGEATWFEDIYVLPPGSVLTFENGLIHIDKYWDISEITIDRRIGYQEALEGIVDKFRVSIERRHKASKIPEVVFLSGGIDSRRIAAELKKQKADFSTYTTRGFNKITTNKTLSEMVSKKLGVQNTFINLPKKNFFRDFWPRCNQLLDFETNLHQWMLPLVDSFNNEFFINYDGIGGDVLINAVLRTSGFLSPEGFSKAKKMSKEQLAHHLAGPKMDVSFLAPILGPNLSYESVLEAIKGELSKYENNENFLTCFYLLNRTRRGIAISPMRLIETKIESYLPYLDNDFVQFVLSIPLEIRVSHPLRRETLDLAYPHLKHIDNSVYLSRNKRGEGDANDIAYDKQRRQFLWQCVRYHFIKNSWMFSVSKTLPRIIKDIFMRTIDADHVSHVFSASFEVFYEFLEENFSKELMSRREGNHV